MVVTRCGQGINSAIITLRSETVSNRSLMAGKRSWYWYGEGGWGKGRGRGRVGEGRKKKRREGKGEDRRG